MKPDNAALDTKKENRHAYVECNSNRLTLDPGVLWRKFRQQGRIGLGTKAHLPPSWPWPC